MDFARFHGEEARDWFDSRYRKVVGRSLADIVRDERVSVTAMAAWLVFVLSTFFALGGYKVNKLIRFDFGPSDSLFFVGVHVNTWPKYILLMVFVSVDALIECWPTTVVEPWLLTSVYSLEPSPLEYSITTTMWIANTYQLCSSVRVVIQLYIAFTQIDVLLVRLFSLQCASQITSWLTVRNRSEKGMSGNGGGLYVDHSRLPDENHLGEDDFLNP